MDYLTLLIGLLIGAILGFIGNQLFQKIKAEQKEDNDQDDVISEIKALKQEVKEYNDSANTDRGSINQILTDMRTAEQQVGQAAIEIKRTLVTGGGQKQGAWGQLILEHILENKLQFTKGEEFEVQKSFNTNDGGDTSGFQRCNNSVATNNSYEDGIDDSIRTAKRTNTTTSSFIRRGLKGIYGTIREENTTSSSNDNSPFRRSGSGGGAETHHGDSSCYDQSVETNSTNDDHNSMLVENHMLIATMPLKGGDNTDVFHSDTTGTTDSSGYSGSELGNGNVYE